MHLRCVSSPSGKRSSRLGIPAARDRQWHLDWSKHLKRLAYRSNPIIEQLFPELEVPLTYYWTLEESERATTRAEGVRIKHRINRNSLKMYDKAGSVLRVETTINVRRDMKVFRHKEGDLKGPKKWRPLRKGIADIRRRVQISQPANERYLNSLADWE